MDTHGIHTCNTHAKVRSEGSGVPMEQYSVSLYWGERIPEAIHLIRGLCFKVDVPGATRCSEHTEVVERVLS